MSNGIVVDTDYFEGVNLDSPSIKHPIFEKMQADARAKAIQSQDDLLCLFDNDVKQTLKQHNTPKDRERLNTMIRVLFATA